MIVSSIHQSSCFSHVSDVESICKNASQIHACYKLHALATRVAGPYIKSTGSARQVRLLIFGIPPLLPVVRPKQNRAQW